MDKKSSTQLSACAEEISRTKTAKGLKVRIEVQHIERVIQTFCVYLKLLAFHFQDQLFTGKTLKIMVLNLPTQTYFQKL